MKRHSSINTKHFVFNLPKAKKTLKYFNYNKKSLKKVFLNSSRKSSERTKLETHKRVCRNKDFCSVGMPSKENTLLEFNQSLKFNKSPSIPYFCRF